jgi:glutathione peroxidase
MLATKSGTTPKWNFYKYLMDKNGNIVDSYSQFTKPNSKSFIKTIEKTLQVELL